MTDGDGSASRVTTRSGGGTMPPDLMRLPGHERLAHFVDGTAPLSGVQLLTGVRPVSADEVTAIFELVVGPGLADGGGYLPLGAMATLADGALGWAVTGRLAAGSSCATVVLNLNLVHRVAVGSALRSEARLVSLDDRTALSETVILDVNDRVVADGSARSVVFNRGPASGQQPRADIGGEDVRSGDPQVIDGGDVDGLTGIESVRAMARGERAPDPVHDLLGFAVTEYGKGEVTITMPADKRVEQTMGAVQGGALALMADQSMATAVLTTLPAGSRTHMVDVHVSFARSQPADGQRLHARAKVRHRGRRLALTSVTILNTAGRIVAFGSGTAVITSIPGA